jgi:hypothetical protein
MKNVLELLEAFIVIPLYSGVGRVGSSYASYSGGLGFKSRPGDRLFGLKSFVIFLSLSKCWDISHIMTRPIPITALSNHYSPLSYHPMLYTEQRSWLRHYATSRKVAGSIPDEVIWISKNT